jgi:hypothetical protein
VALMDIWWVGEEHGFRIMPVYDVMNLLQELS